jgi:hypothetical protein
MPPGTVPGSLLTLPTFGRTTVHVFTFKEGVLARAAHDLRLTLERCQITSRDDTIVAIFEMASLRVDGAMRDGELDPGQLDPDARREIERTMRNRILSSERYPEARLEARARVSGATCAIEGELELVGRRRHVAFEARASGDAWIAEVELIPSRWGIRPYSAMLGAIRLADRVRVVARMTDSGAA